MSAFATVYSWGIARKQATATQGIRSKNTLDSSSEQSTPEASDRISWFYKDFNTKKRVKTRLISIERSRLL